MTNAHPLAIGFSSFDPVRHTRTRASADALRKGEAIQPRAKLSCRLRRVLTAYPRAKSFSVSQIIQSLGDDTVGPSLALFSAASVLKIPDIGGMSGSVTSALGVGLAFGHKTVALPHRLLRRKIPRNSLALLIHGISALLDAADGVIRQRWSWVFHPAVSAALGLTLFLLGLASMAPIIGGGVQHAASAFLVAVGVAERDGLAVMIGAVAGIASLAFAAMSLTSGRKVWTNVKAWLVQCARKLRLDALAHLLDRCCDGLGELVRMRWSGLLLFIVSPGTPDNDREESRSPSKLRDRAQRVRKAVKQGMAA